MGSICMRLREACNVLWQGLHAHPFIRELAAGTLPPEKFRFFVEQNLQYLPEYARAMAIAVSKASDVQTMRLFAADLSNVLVTEIPENHDLRRRILELGAEDRGAARCMAPANVAYTGFLVSTAAQSGLLETMAALVPCTWSYGEIAEALVAEGLVHEHPVYAEWIRFYSEEPFTSVVAKMRADFEEMAADADQAMVARLSEKFTMSTRLERGFWDMAYRMEQWPDLIVP
jgi:thiaminase/transcriptional activator TenA